VICSDRAEPGDTAKELHRSWGVADRIEYQVIDAVHIPYEERFDIIVFKSVLGGIWAYRGTEVAHEVIRQIHKALKPNGTLLFAENLRASSLHMAFRKKFADRRWHYPTLQQMVDLLKPYSNVEYRLAGFLGMFGPTGGWRNGLGHVDHAIAPLTPDRWRYVMAGVAQK
jgi:SAM-dependent methyltransferase